MTERLPPAPPEQRMQRVRVGLTGLAAVILIVALATAIASGVARRAAIEGNHAAVIENSADAANAADKPSEPLAQLGVAPGAGEKADETGKGKARR